jgi:ATP-dependent Lon protease
MTSPDTEFISILEATEAEGESSSRGASRSMPNTLPILGLSDIVIFPGIVAPLLVDTKEGSRLIDDVVGGDRFLGLVLQRRADVENPMPDDLWEHGCVGRVTKMLKLADNTVRVEVQGLRRFEIVKYQSRRPYLKARVKFLSSGRNLESIELTALTRNTHEVFEEIIELSPTLNESVQVAARNTDDPSRLSDLIAANLNLSLEERQELLAMNQVVKRLNRLLPLLHREREVLALGSKIQKDVAGAMSKNQREFFLREQIRAIQRELGESDPVADELSLLGRQIVENGLPEEAASVARKELERLQTTPPASGEHTIIRNYLDWIVHLPWQKSTKDRLNLAEASRILDANHHGLSKVKDRLLEFLAVLKLKNSLKGPLLCLTGRPSR